jgi:hypothetical protein
MSTWLPIETLPPGCQEALLWGRQAFDNCREDYTDESCWEEPRVHWLLRNYEGKATPLGRRLVTETYYNGEESIACWATHWMPLPEPPSEQEKME